MSLMYPLVHVDDIPIEKMEEKEGWAISEFRLPISGENGSSTTVFHSILGQVQHMQNIYIQIVKK